MIVAFVNMISRLVTKWHYLILMIGFFCVTLQLLLKRVIEYSEHIY